MQGVEWLIIRWQPSFQNVHYDSSANHPCSFIFLFFLFSQRPSLKKYETYIYFVLLIFIVFYFSRVAEGELIGGVDPQNAIFRLDKQQRDSPQSFLGREQQRYSTIPDRGETNCSLLLLFIKIFRLFKNLNNVNDGQCRFYISSDNKNLILFQIIFKLTFFSLIFSIVSDNSFYTIFLLNF